MLDWSPQPSLTSVFYAWLVTATFTYECILRLTEHCNPFTDKCILRLTDHCNLHRQVYFMLDWSPQPSLTSVFYAWLVTATFTYECILRLTEHRNLHQQVYFTLDWPPQPSRTSVFYAWLRTVTFTDKCILRLTEHRIPSLTSVFYAWLITATFTDTCILRLTDHCNLHWHVYFTLDRTQFSPSGFPLEWRDARYNYVYFNNCALQTSMSTSITVYSRSTSITVHSRPLCLLQ